MLATLDCVTRKRVNRSCSVPDELESPGPTLSRGLLVGGDLPSARAAAGFGSQCG